MTASSEEVAQRVEHARRDNSISLDLSSLHLKVLPDTLGSLAALTKLYLGGNQLTAVPDSLASLTNLTKLYLNSNQLTEVPDWLGSLTSLTELGLWGNRLTAVPDSLGSLMGCVGGSGRGLICAGALSS